MLVQPPCAATECEVDRARKRAASCNRAQTWIPNRCWRPADVAPILPLTGTSPCEAKVALAAIKGDRTLAQLAEQFDVHPNQVTSWKAQLEGGAADVFGPGGGNGVTQPAVDVKSLHAKIGALTLENDFLEGALSKAGLLSAKR